MARTRTHFVSVIRDNHGNELAAEPYLTSDAAIGHALRQRLAQADPKKWEIVLRTVTIKEKVVKI